MGSSTIDQCLRAHVEPTLGLQPLADIRRGDVQKIIDELTPRLSGSRCGRSSTASARCTGGRNTETSSSTTRAARIRLPAMNATSVRRIASPAEFTRLLDALHSSSRCRMRSPGMGWDARPDHSPPPVRGDLAVGAIECGVEWEARKYDASRRVVPILAPLLMLLKRRHEETGHPNDGLVCPPLAQVCRRLLSG